jgi:hypothetical protein
VLGNAAVSAGRTGTFLGERYRRIARRPGRKKAVVAIGRSILVIIWHLPADPDARYTDLGSDFYDTRINPERRRRNHIRQLEALGYKVILERAARPPRPDQPGSADAPPGAAARPLTLRFSDQPLVPLARRRTGVKIAGGTARDVVFPLVRLRPRVSLRPPEVGEPQASWPAVSLTPPLCEKS